MSKSVSGIFETVFGAAPELCAFAPGRVNLIGEHTDYNGGRVFPCALGMGISCAARASDDRSLRFYSANFPNKGVTALSLDRLETCGSWADYPIAVIKAFKGFGYEPERGADFAFLGDLPDGAGLSSSAALEVLTGLVISALYGFKMTAQELAVLGQFAENRFIGVNCGIMDQFASAMGRENSAILLDSLTLSYKYAPVPEEAALVIINSGVKHSLASSAYNDRRRECETALADINTAIKAPLLCSLAPDQFERYKDAIKSPVCQRRAKHAVYENARAYLAAQVLESGDLNSFGELMMSSHISLRDDYEVSCAELDFLAEAAWSAEGVYGARMTGGGFGGCTVNLVKKDYANAFIKTITKKYRDRFGTEAAAYRVKIGGGARLL